MKARRSEEARRPITALLAACAALATVASAIGCAGIEPDAVQEIAAPPFEENAFRDVSNVLEQRCGTLDCHGAMARPFRIYGQPGLRRYEPEGSENVEDYSQYYSGGLQATTGAELRDNYRSLCGLEPELLEQVFAKKADPQVLTLVRKARLLEKHKGGLLWNKGEPGDVCLTNWLTGNIDTAQCDVELSHP
jgi:hypothetical protein